MPVALLGCLVIAAPLAVAWRWPLAMTAALWSAAALFSAFVTPLGTKVAAISLAFVPPFMVAYFGDRRRAAAGLGICCLGGLLCFGWDGFARQYDLRHHPGRLDRRPRPSKRALGWSRSCEPTTSCSPGRARSACVTPSRRNGPGSRVTCMTRSVTT